MRFNEEGEKIVEADKVYSGLVEAVQEFEDTLEEYESAAENYEDMRESYRKGRVHSEDLELAVDALVQKDYEISEMARELNDAANGVKSEVEVAGEEAAVAFATEHTLAEHGIEESSSYPDELGEDFVSTVYELNDAEKLVERKDALMERDSEFLQMELGYTWEDAYEKVMDHDLDAVEEVMESATIAGDRENVIEKNPNDVYLGGVESESGTEDLEAKREEVIGSSEELRKKREEVLGSEDELEEARERVKDREPRYLQ